jgi:sucrose phosphorylase
MAAFQPMAPTNPLLELLAALYGPAAAPDLVARLQAAIARYRPTMRAPGAGGVSQQDAILITYGDQVRAAGQAPLRTLSDFCRQHLSGLVNAIHILPFYPYSSDDGFSVIDYRAVDPALGAWDDIAALGRNFRLMFDAVINHISAESEWFLAFLRGDPRYRNYFVAVEGSPDLSGVVRPRALPLLTTFQTRAGPKSVWTTFSADQVDLNYGNPEVLLEIVDLLLFYAARGAEFIRLDAIAYLWKEIGTACIHLPETHTVIQLFRAVLDGAAPHVALITETNVPHVDNISYFGDGSNEAQMVYNFALPPLTLHAFQAGDASALSAWAAGLRLPSRRVTFFNFLASHDGIGLNPARGLLSESDIAALADRAVAQGGFVSYKHNPDGSQSPYELNINYFDALSDPAGGEPLEVQAARFLAAQAVMLSLVGVPGIYFHSLLGSRGWPAGAAQTGRPRSINREKLARAELERELADAGSLRRRVLDGYARMLRARSRSAAFHPYGNQQVIECGPAIFALLRVPPAGGERVLCLHNVTARPQAVALDWTGTVGGRTRRDLISREVYGIGQGALSLEPYQVLWLAEDREGAT